MQMQRSLRTRKTLGKGVGSFLFTFGKELGIGELIAKVANGSGI